MWYRNGLRRHDWKFVGFEDLNRKDYGDITAADFSYSVTVSADFLVLNLKPGNLYNSFGYKLTDMGGYTITL